MEKRKAVRFTETHGVYVKGDIAGFNPVKADRLIAAGVASAYDGKGVEPQEMTEADLRDAAKMLASEQEKQVAQQKALDDRAAELDRREADLAAKESGEGKADTKDGGGGKPPAQGKKS